MIKRRFYRYEHGDKDVPSETSSSSDSDAEAASHATDDSEDEKEEDDVVVVADVREQHETSSSSSGGYESEDSSANEVNLDSSGLPSSDDDDDDDDDMVAQNSKRKSIGSFSTRKGDTVLPSSEYSPEKEEEIRSDLSDRVLKLKSVFKCRLCPRIVCLSEETLKAHLSSKRHARSEKLLKEGRLKFMLNDNGQIEGDDADPEEPVTTAVSGQKPAKPKKKVKGRSKQGKRSRQEANPDKAKGSTENRKQRRKSKNI